MTSNSFVAVTCDACGEKSLIPDFFIGANCQSKKCSSAVLLKPVKDGNKYVRIICHEQIHYTSVAVESKSTKCACCQEEFIILDTIVEVRCGQMVYCARRKVPVEEQLRSVNVNDLKTENLKNDEDEDTRKMEDLKSENCSLVKKISELEEELKRTSENSLKELNDLKNDVIELNKENNRLNAKILEDAINGAEMRKNLEIYASEKHQLLNKLATVNALYQSASITGNRMVEQINTLMVSNLNLTETVKKMANGVPQKIVDEKEAEEAQKPMEEPEKEAEKEEGPLTVPCSVCGVKATLEKGAWNTHCKESGCQGNGNLILAPVKEEHKIVRRACRNAVTFSLVPISQKTLQCSCCKRGFNITDVVIEVRNDQKIFKADAMVLAEDELKELKEKLNNMKGNLKSVEEDRDNQLNTLGYEILDLEKNHLKTVNLLKADINSKDEALKILQKDLNEAVFLLDVYERDKKAIISNSAAENDPENLANNLLVYQNNRLTEINKMLMEKIKNGANQ